ncbi:hypothetical protein ADUPG1_010205 [Aduncisulcus paluster]|uniref:Transmembrane protein n=1 Tax=Aduncisulcus paluster TaxID=2918883 RepID=A0ABQ5JV68_9EUKA|nr:hypothetical protein ADUPG1_010205 [Aduncisulcus paluster]
MHRSSVGCPNCHALTTPSTGKEVVKKPKPPIITPPEEIMLPGDVPKPVISLPPPSETPEPILSLSSIELTHPKIETEILTAGGVPVPSETPMHPLLDESFGGSYGSSDSHTVISKHFLPAELISVLSVAKVQCVQCTDSPKIVSISKLDSHFASKHEFSPGSTDPLSLSSSLSPSRYRAVNPPGLSENSPVSNDAIWGCGFYSSSFGPKWVQKYQKWTARQGQYLGNMSLKWRARWFKFFLNFILFIIESFPIVVGTLFYKYLPSILALIPIVCFNVGLFICLSLLTLNIGWASIKSRPEYDKVRLACESIYSSTFSLITLISMTFVVAALWREVVEAGNAYFGFVWIVFLKAPWCIFCSMIGSLIIDWIEAHDSPNSMLLPNIIIFIFSFAGNIAAVILFWTLGPLSLKRAGNGFITFEFYAFMITSFICDFPFALFFMVVNLSDDCSHKKHPIRAWIIGNYSPNNNGAINIFGDKLESLPIIHMLLLGGLTICTIVLSAFAWILIPISISIILLFVINPTDYDDEDY